LVKIKDIRSYGSKVAHLIEISHDELKKAKQLAASTEGTLQDVRVEGETATGWFMSNGCDACRPLAFRGAFLVKGRLLDDGSMEFSFIVPGDKGYRKILEELYISNIMFNITRVSRFRSSKILTTKQEMALYIALKMGLFEHPRRTSIEELAKMLGVKPSTLAESIRRGLRRLLEHYFVGHY
jgi:predicted DNA binding protein